MKKKQGISLIVLVITIIVMIILAASVVITLSNTSVINRASEAVDATNEKQVQDLAALVWADKFMDGKRGDTLKEEVLKELEDYTDDYDITVTDTGIKAKKKGSTTTPTTTLGSLITAENYGDTVNYEANGITDWKIFYETEDYVYLIASEVLAYDKVPTTLKETVANGGAGATISSETVTLGENDTRTVGRVYWADENPPTSAGTIQNPTMWMANWSDYTTNKSGRCVSYFLDETHWTAFKNTTATYKEYVEGAIGTPTAEMFVASWNAKREIAVAKGDTTTYNKKLSLVANGKIGYYVNDITTSDPASSNTTSQTIGTTDNLYIWSAERNSSTWLASPSGYADFLLSANRGGHVYGSNSSGVGNGVRPVVCLKSSIPATVGTGDYDFSLIK